MHHRSLARVHASKALNVTPLLLIVNSLVALPSHTPKSSYKIFLPFMKPPLYEVPSLFIKLMMFLVIGI